MVQSFSFSEVISYNEGIYLRGKSIPWLDIEYIAECLSSQRTRGNAIPPWKSQRFFLRQQILEKLTTF